MVPEPLPDNTPSSVPHVPDSEILRREGERFLEELRALGLRCEVIITELQKKGAQGDQPDPPESRLGG